MSEADQVISAPADPALAAREAEREAGRKVRQARNTRAARRAAEAKGEAFPFRDSEFREAAEATFVVDLRGAPGFRLRKLDGNDLCELEAMPEGVRGYLQGLQKTPMRTLRDLLFRLTRGVRGELTLEDCGRLMPVNPVAIDELADQILRGCGLLEEDPNPTGAPAP